MKTNKICEFCKEAYKELIENGDRVSLDGITFIRFDRYMIDNKYLNGKILALNFHDRIGHFFKCIKNSGENVGIVETASNIAYLYYGHKTEDFNSVIKKLKKLHEGVYLSKILV